ncbi:heme-thiolate peroxidase [Candolleomyces aberdarensis]|uniref:Heme-thiolate peroxidase n=1 Tax=Candolleomyces aberdarensis TaxID=2316362 RepID=A0A4Q2DFP6_9AGAR|nr:heme-thiolate peroxidase [Candolleomyces aberdarensis]
MAVSIVLLLSHITLSFAFPSYVSLGGLSEREQDEVVAELSGRAVFPPKPPGPLEYNGTKLVHDKAHPWKPLRKGDIRGPCPGLNTLASHGYLPRDGVATPAQIVNAVQEGLNMDHIIAVFATYGAFLVDGNLVTNLLSIGGKTRNTGPDPPKPAIVGGLNTHAVFEGDASMTRADDFFGDNHSFNQTLWDQFVDFSNRYGEGYYNLTVAAELRWQLIQQAISTNPHFSLVAPRYFTAFVESVFPLNLFVDGRDTTSPAEGRKLDLDAALSFFRDHRFPPEFHRASTPSGIQGIEAVIAAHPIAPGANADGKVNNYVIDPTSADFGKFWDLF